MTGNTKLFSIRDYEGIPVWKAGCACLVSAGFLAAGILMMNHHMELSLWIPFGWGTPLWLVRISVSSTYPQLSSWEKLAVIIGFGMPSIILSNVLGWVLVP